MMQALDVLNLNHSTRNRVNHTEIAEAVVDHIKYAVWCYKPNEGIVYHNSKFNEFFNIDDEFIRKNNGNIWKAIFGEQFENAKANFNEICEGKSGALVICDKTKTNVFEIEYDSIVLDNSKCTVGVIRDVTKRQLMLHELNELKRDLGNGW